MSRTLPDRMNPLATGNDGLPPGTARRPTLGEAGLEHIEPRQNDGLVAQEGRVVAGRVEVRERQLLRDRRLRREELLERPALVGSRQGGTLDDGVCLVAAHPPLDELEEQPAAR